MSANWGEESMIDTLKFAKKMHEKGAMSREQADAFAESLNEAMLEQAATKKDLDLLESRLSNKLYAVAFAIVLASGIMPHIFK
jgi:arginyl-tRNA--protein-N-Asp/Glu arginylyltransferase